ncbi:hypothetical protein [Amphibacillus jilinensis]|uniref:hypothetical protein n=1 Tax=Amphibacillus jilinensis TaxID=1216008 RepID=UPI0002D4F282|nr:hypothetical protein [Amphibacillus jilinensis]
MTSSEQELLYQYLQNHYLTDEKRDQINALIVMLTEQNVDELQSHLNYNVLVSEETLITEIALIEAYLYSGKDNKALDINHIQLVRLKSYLSMLNKYQEIFEGLNLEFINEEKIYLKVDQLSFEKKHGYLLLKSKLLMDISPERINITRKQFINSNNLSLTLNELEISYYYSSNALSQYILNEKETLIGMSTQN